MSASSSAGASAAAGAVMTSCSAHNAPIAGSSRRRCSPPTGEMFLYDGDDSRR